MKKIIPALALLLVSAVMLATSSFAWFSMNTTVTVTGMSVSTRISDNLQIANDTIDSNAKKADNLFQNGLNQTAEVNPTVEGILEPVSTVDGVAFFYTATDNVYANGDAMNDTYIAYNPSTAATDAEHYSNAFSENYDVKKSDTAVAYVDYVFQIKAINSDTSVDKNVKLTGVNLLYNNLAAAGDNIKAFRVAVFAEKYNEDSVGNAHESNAFHAIGATYDHDSDNETPEIGYGKLVTILAPESAAYRTPGKAVADTDGPVTDGAMTTSVSNLGSNANIGTVAAGTTGYFKVVVRLWLEGEDTTCNSQTYLSLTKNWTLDLKMDLGTGDGVTAIGSATSAVVTASNLVGTVTLDGTGKIANGETPASYQWIDASTGAAPATGTGADTYQYTATAEGDFYCVITSTRGSIYTTTTVTLAPAPAP